MADYNALLVLGVLKRIAELLEAGHSLREALLFAADEIEKTMDGIENGNRCSVTPRDMRAGRIS